MAAPPTATPILVVQAHPDDADISSGASVARWAREGRRVIYVACTSGEAGESEPRVSREELGVLREQELNESAAELGVAEVLFLRHPDGNLSDASTLRDELTDLILSLRPATIVTHDPVSEREGHPDHWNAGRATLHATLHAAEQGHGAQQVLLFRTRKPNMAIDVSATIEIKLAAIERHRTQRSMGEAPPQAVVDWARAAGGRWGLPMAETFRSLTLQQCREMIETG